MKTTLLVAAATALALLAADTASAGSRLAYFKVSLVASQDVTWTKHLTFASTCGARSRSRATALQRSACALPAPSRPSGSA